MLPLWYSEVSIEETFLPNKVNINISKMDGLANYCIYIQYFCYIPAINCLESYHILEVLRTNPISGRMKTFVAFYLFEQFIVSIFNSWRILNRFQGEWAFFQSSMGWKQYWCCLPSPRQRIKRGSRSQAAGWICTDWEQRQLMIAYQRVRFLPSSHSGEWASSAWDFSPEEVAVLGFNIF